MGPPLNVPLELRAKIYLVAFRHLCFFSKYVIRVCSLRGTEFFFEIVLSMKSFKNCYLTYSRLKKVSNTFIKTDMCALKGCC